MIFSSIGKSLKDEVDSMVASIEQNGKDVDRVASIEHMNDTRDIKIGMLV
jgi:hypothetical protein